MSPTIAIVNATPLAMAPAEEAFAEGFPEAEPWHLLDGRLVREADAAGGLTPALTRRMLDLIDYAVRGGADAVQLSCSMYAPAAHLAAGLYDVPVRASDDALFAEVARRAPKDVLVIGSLRSAAADTARRLREAVPGVTTRPAHYQIGGMTQGFGGAPRGWQSVADLQVSDENPSPDLGGPAGRGGDPAELIVLAQYSITSARAALAERLGRPVLSPPLLAAMSLREALA